MAEAEIGRSVQDKPTGVSSPSMILGPSSWAHLLQFRFHGTMQRPPAYWSKGRDEWLVDFVKAEGNDLLAGAESTVTAKVVANSWYVEGPLLLAGFARDQLLYWSNFGLGWSSMISPAVQGFLGRDAGGELELHRASATDMTGPAMGYSHLDESKTRPTGDPKYPLVYRGKEGDIRISRSQCIRLVDMPSGKDSLNGVGYCATSRATTIALTLQQVAKYKRERLSDLPPAALLLLNNLSLEEWGDISANYDVRMERRGNEVWRNVMVAFGVDPAYPLSADMVEFSQLPEHFSEKEFTEITVYSLALAYREDPREFWPVSSGPLGTATEAELQARSARLKGEGIIKAAIERELNRSEALPPEVHFHFDFQDDEQDRLVAEVNNLRSSIIRRFWEPPTGGGENSTDGIITTEEARDWAIRERVIPWDVLSQPVDIERIYDTKTWHRYKGFGPVVRIYQDGTCSSLEKSGGVRWRS